MHESVRPVTERGPKDVLFRVGPDRPARRRALCVREIAAGTVLLAVSVLVEKAVVGETIVLSNSYQIPREFIKGKFSHVLSILWTKSLAQAPLAKSSSSRLSQGM
jgi:hypothetical protein